MGRSRSRGPSPSTVRWRGGRRTRRRGPAPGVPGSSGTRTGPGAGEIGSRPVVESAIGPRRRPTVRPGEACPSCHGAGPRRPGRAPSEGADEPRRTAAVVSPTHVVISAASSRPCASGGASQSVNYPRVPRQGVAHGNARVLLVRRGQVGRGDLVPGRRGLGWVHVRRLLLAFQRTGPS